jgi:hypothetical protein
MVRGEARRVRCEMTTLAPRSFWSARMAFESKALPAIGPPNSIFDHRATPTVATAD